MTKERWLGISDEDRAAFDAFAAAQRAERTLNPAGERFTLSASTYATEAGPGRAGYRYFIHAHRVEAPPRLVESAGPYDTEAEALKAGMRRALQITGLSPEISDANDEAGS
jgi:hypothetical protein